jgi:hypothetical protein
MGECVDPEGNGVTMKRGARGGLAHPVGNKISSWSATAEEMRLPWNQEDSKTGPMRHQELITHRVRNIVKWWPLFCLYIVSNKCVNVTWCLTLIVCFRRINHMVVLKNLCIHPLMYTRVASGTESMARGLIVQGNNIRGSMVLVSLTGERVGVRPN